MPIENLKPAKRLRYNIRTRTRALDTSASVSIRDKVIAHLKIDRSTYYKWLKVTMCDGNDVPGKALKLFAEIFNCPMESLFNEKTAE